MHLVGSWERRIPGGHLASRIAHLVVTGQRLLGGWDSIRTRLVLLALVSTAPLLLLVAINASQDVADARRDAQTEALRVAQLHANLIDEHVQAIDVLLRAVSTTVSTDAEQNEALLRRIFAELPPAYTALFMGPPEMAQANPAGLTLQGTSVSPATGVAVSRPILGPDGQVVAVLNAASRLDRLPRLETRDLPAGSVIMILDERGVVLARSPDYDAWVGRDLSDLPDVQQALQRRQGSGELVGADGVTRLFAYTSATRAPWLVYVGLPSEIVLGSSHVALLRNLWFGVLALGAAVLVAWLMAGRITAPLRRLAADASALGRGDLARRTQVDRHDEVGVLAAVFNQMAEAVEHHVADLRASQLREQDARLQAEGAAQQIAEREQRLQDLVRRLQVA
jgi:HAMP domain-containing protein